MGFTKESKKQKVTSHLQKIIADKELLNIWYQVHTLEQSLTPADGWDRDDFFHWTKLPR
jgi:hypothetical protein